MSKRTPTPPLFSLLLLSALLALTGCYQPAGDDFVPVSVGDAGATSAASPEAPVGTLIVPDATDSAPDVLPTDAAGDSAPTDVPLPTDGLGSDTAQTPDTAETPDAAGGTPPLIFTVAASATPTETLMPTSAPTEADTTDPTPPTETPLFITPGSPGDPIVVPTSTPPPLSPTPTPGGDEDSGGDDSSDPGGDPGTDPQPTTAPEDLPDDCVHVVSAGENLFRIALRYETSVGAFLNANPGLGSGTLLSVGQELVIPGCEDDGSQIAPTEAAPTEAAPTEAPPEGVIEHVVVAGDTIYALARTYGSTVSAIVQANNLSNPDRLQIGDVLRIPVEDE